MEERIAALEQLVHHCTWLTSLAIIGLVLWIHSLDRAVAHLQARIKELEGEEESDEEEAAANGWYK